MLPCKQYSDRQNYFANFYISFKGFLLRFGQF